MTLRKLNSKYSKYDILKADKSHRNVRHAIKTHCNQQALSYHTPTISLSPTEGWTSGQTDGLTNRPMDGTAIAI